MAFGAAGPVGLVRCTRGMPVQMLAGLSSRPVAVLGAGATPTVAWVLSRWMISWGQAPRAVVSA